MANVLGLHLPHSAPQHPECLHLHLLPLLVGHKLDVFLCWRWKKHIYPLKDFGFIVINVSPVCLSLPCFALRTVGMHPEGLRFLCFTAVVLVPHVIGEPIK